MSHSNRKKNKPVLLPKKQHATVDTSPPLDAQVAFNIFQKVLKEDLDEDGVKKEFRSQILNYVLLHGIDKTYKKEIDKDNV